MAIHYDDNHRLNLGASDLTRKDLLREASTLYYMDETMDIQPMTEEAVKDLLFFHEAAGLILKTHDISDGKPELSYKFDNKSFHDRTSGVIQSHIDQFISAHEFKTRIAKLENMSDVELRNYISGYDHSLSPPIDEKK